MTAPFEYGREDWRADPDAAYAEAARRTAWAKQHPEEPWLFLSDLLALTRLPPDLAACAHLTRLDIGDATGPDGELHQQPHGKYYEIADWSPLTALTGLETLRLARCRIETLAPIAGATRLQSLDLAGSKVTDLAPIAGATGLQSLNLAGSKVTDLAPIAGATGLQSLNLGYTKVTDLAPIAGATRLQSLNLWDTKVTDLAPIAGATGLQSLDLEGTKVTDLAPIAGATRLQSLNLYRTKVTDLAPIAGATGLQSLNLAGSKVTDLAPIAGATGLQSLNLYRTDVTDLAPIAGATGLQSLDLYSTKVADLTPLRANPAFLSKDPFTLDIRETPLADLDDDWRAIAALEESQDTARRAVAQLLAEGHVIPPPPDRPKAPRPDRYVFISYARADAVKVDRICAAIEAAGLPIWRDVRDGEIGADVNAMIERAVDGAAATLTLWSPAAVASDYVRAEAERSRAQGKLVPALIAPAAPPLVFSGKNTADLTTWAGDAADPGFQGVLTALRMRLYAERSQVEAVEEDGRFRLAARPVRLRPPEDDEIRRARALRAQAELAEDFVAEIAFEDAERLSNPDKRLIRRLEVYSAALIGNDPLWETIDQRFARAAPLLDDKALDEGLADSVARLRAGHADLERRLRPDQSEAPPEADDQVDPARAAAAVPELRAIRNLPEETFAPEIEAFIQDQGDQVEVEAAEGPDAPTDAAEAASRSRTGRALRSALGVIGTLAAGMTMHSWSVSPEGRAVLTLLTRAAETLARLLG